MESLDGRCPGLHPSSAVLLRVVSGANPLFPLCFTAGTLQTEGCSDGSFIPAPAWLQDMEWEAVRGGDGATGRQHSHPQLSTSPWGGQDSQGQTIPVLWQRPKAGNSLPVRV